MKRFLIILLTMGVLFVSGCAKSDYMPGITEQGGDTNSLTPQDNLSDNKSDTTSTETPDNSFFFEKNVLKLSYDGRFLFDDIAEGDAKLNIIELAELKYGRLYELKLEPAQGIPDECLSLGYFFVQKDKIYKMEPTKENLGKMKKDGVLPNGSVIVCQDEEIKDISGEDEPGFHHYLKATGDKREYHSYNNQVSTGYYEVFTWEKGKGLIYYRSGYGAERDSIELK